MTKSKKARAEPEPKASSPVKIGPNKLTRFEKARIVGARALQIATGAPLLVQPAAGTTNPIDIAIEELNARILPITIRRSMPDGASQDIPIQWLTEV